MRLIINGENIELEKTKITRTLQVNDIISLKNRQSNYSNTFKIPKTANNVRAFSRLGINANNSNIPYQRNNAYLYSDSEHCLVYNGWAVVKETSDYYSCNVVDGNIDLYKAIENKTLSDLNLAEVNHFKTLDNVVNSFSGASVYKYILADYNGKSLYDTNKVNIDYLVPSLPISYLWDKVFDTYGFTYEGEVFNTFNFQNLYMTYPKSATDEDLTPTEYYSNIYSNFDVQQETITTAKVIHNLNNPIEGEFNSFNTSYIVPTDGTYAISTDLLVQVTGYYSNFYQNIVNFKFFNIDLYVNGSKIGLLKSKNDADDYEGTITLQLFAGDVVEILIDTLVGSLISANFISGGIKFNYLSGYNVDFNETLIDFDTKDFLQLVLNYFSLTPIKDKYSNHYKFKTLYEILQNPEVEDWSANNNKFISKNSESYIYGDYAQKNNFVYKYNDSEADYYNGSILVNNDNLQASKDIYEAKIFAPEKIPTNVLPKQTNVYKIWDKNVKDDGSVDYKGLDKRFYLMRSNDYTFNSGFVIGSEQLTTETTIYSAPFESFLDLKFNDVISNNYEPINQILDKSKIVNANIYLTDIDIENIDFGRLKYIQELNSYFLLNKVSSYSEKGSTKVELIKVDYVQKAYVNDSNVVINDFVDGCLYMTFSQGYVYQLQYSEDDGVTWNYLQGELNGGGNFYTFNPTCGFNVPTGALIRMVQNVTGNVISNIFQT